MAKLITYYKHKTQEQTNKLLIRIKKDFALTKMGIIGNTYIDFSGTSDVDCITAGNIWRTAQDRAEGGNEMDILAARLLMGIFHDHLKIIATQANTLLIGNEVGMKSTGLTMALPGEEVGEMDKPIINSIRPVDGVAGRAMLNMVTSKLFNHGTHIEIKDTKTDDVVAKHSKDKHIIQIDGFVRATDYLVRVAYDGTDPTIVWSEWIPYLGH